MLPHEPVAFVHCAWGKSANNEHWRTSGLARKFGPLFAYSVFAARQVFGVATAATCEARWLHARHACESALCVAEGCLHDSVRRQRALLAVARE